MQSQPFVGREQELAALHEELARALAGQGRVCFVCGQAGSGKTALIRRFIDEALARQPDLVAAYGECNAQTGIGDPYLPFREGLALLLGDLDNKAERGEVSPENSSRLRAAFVRSVQVLVDITPELVEVLVPGTKVLGKLAKSTADKAGWMGNLQKLVKEKSQVTGAAGVEQARIFEQFTRFVKTLAADRPLILAVDDLQWADPASVSLLFYLGRRIGSDRILVIGAYRSDDVALGRQGRRHPLEPMLNEFKRYGLSTLIDLDESAALHGTDFVQALLDPQHYAVGDDFRQALCRQTNGHALFTVEMLRSLQETGALVRGEDGRWVEGPGLDWSRLPARVEGVVEERASRLPDDLRRLLMVASVEGEQFTAEVLAKVQQVPVRHVVRPLSGELEREHQLVKADGVRRVGLQRLSLFRFVHSLLQHYLYELLSEPERAYLHHDVGQALEQLFEGQTQQVAVQLERHFELAGDTAKAVQYALQAAQAAQRVSAHNEAYAHLSKGLALLDQLPADSLERAAYELGLQVALGTSLLSLRGYGVEEVGAAFSRARELCRMMGDPPQVLPVIFGLCLYYLVSGQVERCHAEGEQLLERAEQSQDETFILNCHMLLGAASFYRGELAAAQHHCEQAVARYNLEAHRGLAYQVGQDPGVTALSFLSWVLWSAGYGQQSVARSDEARTLARRAGHAYSEVLAVCFASSLHQYRREWAQCQARAEEALPLAKEGHYALWEGLATQTLGLSLAKQGQPQAGLAVYEHAISGWRRTGSRVGFTAVLTYLAEMHLDTGRLMLAEEALAEAFQLAAETGQRWWLPEQYRVRGEILACQGDAAGAEAALREAVDIARGQGARMLELRAAVSLARLSGLPEAQERAQRELAEIYNWFTEDLGSPDLQAARELLGQPVVAA